MNWNLAGGAWTNTITMKLGFRKVKTTGSCYQSTKSFWGQNKPPGWGLQSECHGFALLAGKVQKEKLGPAVSRDYFLSRTLIKFCLWAGSWWTCFCDLFPLILRVFCICIFARQFSHVHWQQFTKVSFLFHKFVAMYRFSIMTHPIVDKFRLLQDSLVSYLFGHYFITLHQVLFLCIWLVLPALRPVFFKVCQRFLSKMKGKTALASIYEVRMYYSGLLLPAEFIIYYVKYRSSKEEKASFKIFEKSNSNHLQQSYPEQNNHYCLSCPKHFFIPTTTTTTTKPRSKTRSLSSAIWSN